MQLCLLPEFALNSLQINWRLQKKKRLFSIHVQPLTGCGTAFSSVFLKPGCACKSGHACMCDTLLPLCPSLGFTEQSLGCTCRLKSLTLFTPFTAKAATVSNTNSLLSSYICSGQSCKDGCRSKQKKRAVCPSL